MRKDIVLPALALAGGAAGLLLRIWQRVQALDPVTQLYNAGAPSSLALLALAMVMAVLSLVLCRGGREISAPEKAFLCPYPAYMTLMTAAAMAFLLAAAAGMPQFMQELQAWQLDSEYHALPAALFLSQLGCVAAACRGRWPDRVMGGFTALQLSLPAFWLALLLVLLFAETLGWLPTSGLRSPNGILLPALVLSWAPMASAARLTRSALLEQLARPYCLAARARGVSRVRLIWHNALPNALPPVVSLLGNTLGGLLGGSVVVESIFALPGLGAYALSAVTNRDYPALQGYVLVTGLVYVAVTTGVDLISMVLDPRIRLGGKAL